MDKQLEHLLATMSLEEKLGQMMQLAALDDSTPALIDKFHLGSLLHAVGEKVEKLDQYQRDNTANEIPLVFGIDAIHGHCFVSAGTTTACPHQKKSSTLLNI